MIDKTKAQEIMACTVWDDCEVYFRHSTQDRKYSFSLNINLASDQYLITFYRVLKKEP